MADDHQCMSQTIWHLSNAWHVLWVCLAYVFVKVGVPWHTWHIGPRHVWCHFVTVILTAYTLAEMIDKAIVDTRLCPSVQFTRSTFVLYRCAKFDWNLGCYACRVLLPLRNTHDAPYGHMWKHDIIHKTISTQYIILSSEQNQPTAIGTMHKTFSELQPCGFWVSKQTETDILITVLCTPPRDKATSN